MNLGLISCTKSKRNYPCKAYEAIWEGHRIVSRAKEGPCLQIDLNSLTVVVGSWRVHKNGEAS